MSPEVVQIVAHGCCVTLAAAMGITAIKSAWEKAHDASRLIDVYELAWLLLVGCLSLSFIILSMRRLSATDIIIPPGDDIALSIWNMCVMAILTVFITMNSRERAGPSCPFSPPTGEMNDQR